MNVTHWSLEMSDLGWQLYWFYTFSALHTVSIALFIIAIVCCGITTFVWIMATIHSMDYKEYCLFKIGEQNILLYSQYSF